jgi:hypothetical protein
MERNRDDRVAESVDAAREDEFWRSNYSSRPYVDEGDDYDRYRPAYQYGWEAYGRNEGRSFDEVEMDLRRDWEERKDTGGLSWERAKQAVRDAWHRVEEALPGDADDDGR